jgi:hypothetical protein
MTTLHMPSVLVIHTAGNKDAVVKFDWDKLLSNKNASFADAISVTDINYSFAVVFSRVSLGNFIFNRCVVVALG